MDISITKHAEIRLKERTQLEKKDLRRIYKAEKIVLLGHKISDQNKHHELIFSTNDQRYFVCLRNSMTSEIVTILTLLYQANVAWRIKPHFLEQHNKLFPEEYVVKIAGDNITSAYESKFISDEKDSIEDLDFLEMPTFLRRQQDSEVEPRAHKINQRKNFLLLITEKINKINKKIQSKTNRKKEGSKDFYIMPCESCLEHLDTLHGFIINESMESNIPLIKKLKLFSNEYQLTFPMSSRKDDKNFEKLVGEVSLDEDIIQRFPSSRVQIHALSINNRWKEITSLNLEHFSYDIEILKENIFSINSVLDKFLKENRKDKWVYIRIRFGNSLEDHFYKIKTKYKINLDVNHLSHINYLMHKTLE